MAWNARSDLLVRLAFITGAMLIYLFGKQMPMPLYAAVFSGWVIAFLCFIGWRMFSRKGPG